MSDRFDLRGKVAVVTGAASDIGLALAAHAAERGMKVALAGWDESLLADSVERVNAKNVPVIAVRTDVSDLSEVREFARRTEFELGVPWLVCNTSETSLELTLQAVIHGVQVFAPDLIERDGGHVVNVVSAGSVGHCPAARFAAMHAIAGLSESLYRELDVLGSHVGVTLVCPERLSLNLTMSCDQKCVSRLTRPVWHRAQPPDALAEEIFAAVIQRRFRISPDSLQMRETSRSTSVY